MLDVLKALWHCIRPGLEVAGLLSLMLFAYAVTAWLDGGN